MSLLNEDLVKSMSYVIVNIMIFDDEEVTNTLDLYQYYSALNNLDPRMIDEETRGLIYKIGNNILEKP